MVYPLGHTGALQVRVLQVCKALAPSFDFLGLSVVQLAAFLAKSVRGQAPRGAKDVRVVVAVVAFSAGCMDGHIGGASMALHDCAGEVVRHCLALVC